MESSFFCSLCRLEISIDSTIIESCKKDQVNSIATNLDDEEQLQELFEHCALEYSPIHPLCKACYLKYREIQHKKLSDFKIEVQQYQSVLQQITDNQLDGEQNEIEMAEV